MRYFSLDFSGLEYFIEIRFTLFQEKNELLEYYPLHLIKGYRGYLELLLERAHSIPPPPSEMSFCPDVA